MAEEECTRRAFAEPDNTREASAEPDFTQVTFAEPDFTQVAFAEPDFTGEASAERRGGPLPPSRATGLGKPQVDWLEVSNHAPWQPVEAASEAVIRSAEAGVMKTDSAEVTCVQTGCSFV